MSKSLAHLREVAEAATPGRWWTEGPNDDGIFAHVPDGRPNGEGIARAVYYGKQSSPENARHIATFDPPTVKLMLDVIEAAADYRALIESPTEPAEHLVERVYRHLFAALDALMAL